jgi:sulfoxide reductase catalytic subunit YedY
MRVIRRRGWEIPNSRAAPESLFVSRRTLVFGGSLAVAGGAISAMALVGRNQRPAGALAAISDPSRQLYPAARNERYAVERAITPEEINTRYNNFYEFGTSRRIYREAAALKIRPWEIRFDGLVDNPFTIGIDDLLKRVSLEERVYRHRFLEPLSMVVPWTGFALARLVEMARPLSAAKYVRMEAFFDPDVADGQKQFWYPWPYVEGLTMAEATNELAFIVTGAYGKPLANSMGAPLRLHLPWKYGFKSIKSITRISFVDVQPRGFWQQAAPDSHGFWANVNPDVPHPRWSQATERDLTTNEPVPTQLFNGYGRYVADLYADMEGQQIYM